MPSADFCSAIRPPHGALSRRSDTEQISWSKFSRLPYTVAGSTLRILDGYVSLSTSIEGESLDYRTWNVRVAPELPSRIVIMKNWHRTCLLPLVSFFCSTPQSHSSVPTAFHPGHCVSGSQGWPPPSAATASAARSVLDGREHGGTLSRIGDDLPNSASRILYRLRERELEVHGTPACAAIKCCDRNAIKQRDPAYMDFAVSGPLIRCSRLVPGSCPSTRTFALRFLQTSPRGDSPCVVANPSPPSGWVEDFHLQATEHVQHTTKSLRDSPLKRELSPRL